MRKIILMLLMLSAIPAVADKKWKIAPDSLEERMLLAIQEQNEAAKRLAMLDEFSAKFANSEALPASYRLYLAAYVELQQWDKAIEVADKALDADNEDFDAVVNALRAAQAKADYARALKWTTAAMPLYAKSAAVDTKDLDEDDIKKREDALKRTVEFLEYTMWEACSRDATPERIKYLEAFSQFFPKSERVKKLPLQYALYYGQQQDAAQMLEWAQKAVASDPEDETTLMVLGDIYVTQRTKLSEAVDLADHLLKVMEGKKKPEAMGDDAWGKYMATFQGGAHSIKGRALVLQDKAAPAIPELQAARKLIEPTENAASLSPVLYFLGFALGKEKRYEEARPVLQEAIKLGGAYAAPAQQLLKQVSPGAKR
jgi:tetratricopeptide (TPR) repeat protein